MDHNWSPLQSDRSFHVLGLETATAVQSHTSSSFKVALAKWFDDYALYTQSQ